MRQLLDWQREAGDAGEFLDNLRYEMAHSEIFVFTPKGDIHTLPAGSTPVDFAYSVHTEVGHRCIGAKVDGRLVPLERHLSNGQFVEIFTSKAPNQGPSRDWLGFVASSRAKTKIRQYFAKSRREEAVELGKEAIAKAARRAGLPVQRLISHDALAAVGHDLGYKDIAALYAAVGENHIAATTLVAKVVSYRRRRGGGRSTQVAERSAPSVTRRRSRATGDGGVLVKGISDIQVKLARCCTPVPGDEILGFITKGGAVSVHRVDCTNAASLQKEQARLVRGLLGPDVGVGLPGDRSRSRRWTGRGCSPTSPRRWPTSRSTSCRRTCRCPRTGWRSPGSPSRWPTPSTSATCCARCAASKASTTCTGSPAPESASQQIISPPPSVQDVRPARVHFQVGN